MIPKPARLLRYFANAYTMGMAAIILAMALFNLWTYHATIPPQHTPTAPMDAASAVSFVLWLASIIYSGWSGMNRAWADQ